MKFISALSLSLSFLFTFSTFSAEPEKLVLAKDGKTDYQIVIAGSSPKNVWDGQFLAWFLKEKTGADFPVVGAKAMNRKKPAIYLGNSSGLQKIVGPLPYQGMKNQDHIVKSVGKDIVLYGKGHDADFYAINEFLDRCLGFRIYQKYEVPEIVKTPNLELKPFNWKLSWALAHREICQPQFSDYFRGENTQSINTNREYSKCFNNVISFKDLPAVIQPEQPELVTRHTALKYIPTKSHPPYTGYPFVENQDYFKTNPEFFSMNRQGKRTTDYLCWSNPKMRAEFTKNIEKHFEALGTDNVKTRVGMADGVDVCHCPECEKLAKKYGTPGGAFFEYLMELGELFQKTHPRTVIIASFYQKGQTLIPPKFENGKKFPPNLQFMYADILSKTNKTWDQHPDNRQSFEWLKQAAKTTPGNISVMTYYAGHRFLRFLPYASTNVIVDNLRKIAKLGLKGNFFEFAGYGTGFSYGNEIHLNNFADLNVYLYYRFSKDPNLDYEAEVTDFCKHVYGPAAQLAKAYHDDLVRVSTKDNPYGIILASENFSLELSYLNADNLYKWEKMFDEMTRLVENAKPLYRKNVADLRRTLDIAVYGRWAVVHKKYPEYFKDPAFYRKRIGNPAHPVWGKPVREFLSLSDLHIKYMGKEKPLPAQFKDIPAEKIKRVIPSNYSSTARKSKVPKIVTDDDAAFGYAASIDQPNLPFRFGYHIFGAKRSISQTLTAKDIVPGKYKIYHLGEVQPVTGKCMVWFGFSWGTHYDMNRLMNLTDAQAKYDCWVSLKFPEGYKGKRDDLVLCDQIILVRK